MTTQIFYPKLNDFCRKYLVTGTPESITTGQQNFARLHAELVEEIFEHFMLFDSIAFKVYGENVPFAFLRGAMGEYAFDALLEQKAIKFILWKPMVGFLQQDIPGVNALVSGNLNSLPHSDPEASIEAGMKFMRPLLPRGKRRHLLKKLLPLYVVPADDLAGKAVDIINSAYSSGKLTSFGFSPETQPLTNMPLEARRRLSSCSTRAAGVPIPTRTWHDLVLELSVFFPVFRICAPSQRAEADHGSFRRTGEA